jgi:hypothetical protein
MVFLMVSSQNCNLSCSILVGVGLKKTFSPFNFFSSTNRLLGHHFKSEKGI